MTLSDKRLTLLPAKPPLAKAVLDYYLRNRDFLAPFDPVREESFYTLAYQRRALRRDAAMARKGEGWAFYIASNAEPGKLIGRVALTGAIWGSFCSCFLGYKLDKDYLNRGYMTEAIGLVTRPISCPGIFPPSGWRRSVGSKTRGCPPDICRSTANGRTTSIW